MRPIGCTHKKTRCIAAAGFLYSKLQLACASVRLERVEQTDTGLAVAAIRSHRSQSGLTVSVCSRVSNECVVNRTERSLPFTLVRLLRA